MWIPFCVQVAWTYMIAILCLGHMDLYDQCYDLHFALRSHGPILHVWTDSIEGLWICHFVLRSHGPIVHVWTDSTEGLCICHFVLRSHGPIWLPFYAWFAWTVWLLFCAQVTWTYMISVIIYILHAGHMDLFCMCELTAQRDFGFAILCSGHMDLYDCHFALRLHSPVIYILHLNITMLPSAIPTYHSSPQCKHILFHEMWHYKYKYKIGWNIRYWDVFLIVGLL